MSGVVQGLINKSLAFAIYCSLLQLARGHRRVLTLSGEFHSKKPQRSSKPLSCICASCENGKQSREAECKNWCTRIILRIIMDCNFTKSFIWTKYKLKGYFMRQSLFSLMDFYSDGNKKWKIQIVIFVFPCSFWPKKSWCILVLLFFHTSPLSLLFPIFRPQCK